MKYIKEYGWCYWLGLSIPIFTKIGVFEWQFYAIIIPMVFLVILFKNKDNQIQKLMSGGRFNYDQYKIGYIADDIEQEIEKNGRPKTKEELKEEYWRGR